MEQPQKRDSVPKVLALTSLPPLRQQPQHQEELAWSLLSHTKTKSRIKTKTNLERKNEVQQTRPCPGFYCT